jgi:hypothetical protein
MARSKRVRRGVVRLSKSSTVVIAGLMLLLGSRPSWAGPQNQIPTLTDFFGNTAAGASALVSNGQGSRNSAFGYHALVETTRALDAGLIPRAERSPRRELAAVADARISYGVLSVFASRRI